MNQSLLIVGPDIALRGVGGVTIHVQRLRDYLEKEGYDFDFKDYKSNSLWTLWRAIMYHKMVHIHISNPLYQFVVVLMSYLLGKETIVTLHGNYGRFNALNNWLVKRSLKMAKVPIVINEKSFNVCKSFNKKTILIPAFIPPQKTETLQKEAVAIFDDLHREGKTVFVTNASNVSLDKNGNEIYGIEFLVEYFKDAVDKALVVSDPSGNYEKKYHGIHSSCVFFINYPHSYYEVLKRADYSIRNTSTDGDALSVKESLYLGVPTLCSDAVDRPNGVRLFKYCDRESFEKCLKNNSINKVEIENGAERIIKVYKSIENYV